MKIGVKVYLWTPQSDKSISSQFVEKAPLVRPVRPDQLSRAAETLYSETLTGLQDSGRLTGLGQAYRTRAGLQDSGDEALQVVGFRTMDRYRMIG
jgi:hypothetical protein